jgi:hypothetical protein
MFSRFSCSRRAWRSEPVEPFLGQWPLARHRGGSVRGQASLGEAQQCLAGRQRVEPAIASPAARRLIDASDQADPGKAIFNLHGHIHESRGEARIGRTLALNPGSEYSEGVLRGVIVNLSAKKGVRGYQLVAG